MKFTLLGTCSGTEPMPGRHHVAFTVETAGGVYWFDAGEGCSHTAHVLGIDLLAVRAIFISHVHVDHILGLPGLIRNIRKLTLVCRQDPHPLSGRTIPLFIPDLRCWEGMLRMLLQPDGGGPDYAVDAREYGDGDLFDDGRLRVVALHNEHLGAPGPGEPWRCFSFRIEADGRSAVYSGDVGRVEELVPLIGGGCDLMLMETGHHRVETICSCLRDSGAEFGRLAFIHHGRAILADPAGEARKARESLGRDVVITEDRMVIEL